MTTEPQPAERVSRNPAYITIVPDIEDHMARQAQRQTDMEGDTQTRSCYICKAQLPPRPGETKVWDRAVKQRITMAPDAEHRDVPIRQRCAEIEYRHCCHYDDGMQEPSSPTPLFEPEIDRP